MPDIEIEAEEQKKILKEALQEWLDAKFAAFGRWSLGGMLAMAMFVIAYLYLTQHGWRQ
jgi:hypothetical protein